MSTTALGATGPVKALPPGRYGIPGLLRSEWTKLRSLRSTMWTLGVTVVLGIGISAAGDGGDPGALVVRSGLRLRPDRDEPYRSLLRPAHNRRARRACHERGIRLRHDPGDLLRRARAAPWCWQPRPLVFGASLSWWPRSWLSLLLPGPSPVVGAGCPHDALQSREPSGPWREAASTCVSRAVRARACNDHPPHRRRDQRLLRDPAPRPVMIQALPTSLADKIEMFMPDHIGAAVVSLHMGQETLPVWIGLLVLFGYALALLVIGGVLLVRRDA